jgi:glutathione S-transferase
MTKNARYKLYYSPFACSLAVHAALEKIGEGFELEKIDVKKGQHQTERYLQLNRHGKVPLLQDGKKLIDQGAGILLYLSEQHPEAELMPPAAMAEWGKALSELFYMSNTVHPAFSMAFNPDRFTTGDKTQVFDKTLSRLDALLEELDGKLTQQDFLNGNKPYVADYYLVAMLNWLRIFKKGLNPYPNLRRYKARMDQLPEVSRAVSKEIKDLGFVVASVFKLMSVKKRLSRKLKGKPSLKRHDEKQYRVGGVS